MTESYRDTKNKWDENHRDIVKKSKSKYDLKNPVWSFRPTPDLKDWLEKERWNDEKGTPETNAALLIRKLTKLMTMKREGY